MSERLLLDMDGVICDTMGSAFSIVNQEQGTNIIHADCKDYWFNGLQVQPYVILEVLRRDGFYRDLDVVTGAVGAVNRLREQYDVVVCSQPMSGAVNCEAEKREWLAEHFDKDFAESALIIKDKSKVEGKAIIEDNPFVEGDFEVVMFDQAWNRNRISKYRMFGWHDLRQVRKAME